MIPATGATSLGACPASQAATFNQITAVGDPADAASGCEDAVSGTFGIRVLRELALQRAPVDAEEPARVRDVAIAIHQNALDVFPFPHARATARWRTGPPADGAAPSNAA